MMPRMVGGAAAAATATALTMTRDRRRRRCRFAPPTLPPRLLLLLLVTLLLSVSASAAGAKEQPPRECAAPAASTGEQRTLLIDLTVPIRAGMPTWESARGLPRSWRALSQSQAAGDVVDQSHLNLDAHTGTHVDAPRHFLGAAGATVEALPLEALVGAADVVDVAGETNVTGAFLEAHPPPADAARLLFRTQNTRRGLMGRTAFASDYVGLDSTAADWLARERPSVRLVGVDYLSVGMLEDIEATHRALFKQGVVVVEGLNLTAAPPGRHHLACLPLLATGSDGAPARCVLTVAAEAAAAAT